MTATIRERSFKNKPWPNPEVTQIRSALPAGVSGRRFRGNGCGELRRRSQSDAVRSGHRRGYRSPECRFQSVLAYCTPGEREDHGDVNASAPVCADRVADKRLVADHVNGVDHFVRHGGQGAGPVARPVGGPDGLDGIAVAGPGEAACVGIDDGVREQVAARDAAPSTENASMPVTSATQNESYPRRSARSARSTTAAGPERINGAPVTPSGLPPADAAGATGGCAVSMTATMRSAPDAVWRESEPGHPGPRRTTRFRTHRSRVATLS